MDKTEYLKLQQEIIQRLGKPEKDFDGTPLNESARELKKLYSAYCSERNKERQETKKQLLNEVEQKEIVKINRLKPSVPIELTENDLILFKDIEKQVVIDYFHNTNLTPKDLERKGFSTQKVVALMRSGPFTVLAAKVFDHLMPIEVRNACLKAVREGDKRLIERFSEQYGVLKNQEMTLNVNKPIEDPILQQKLKELGDSL